MSDELGNEYKEYITEVPDFPKPGIGFKDISPLLADEQTFRSAIVGMGMCVDAGDNCPDYWIGIDSRGFIFASALAIYFGGGVVCARKKGKLPPPIISENYKLEYGTDTLEMKPGKGSVVIVDDCPVVGVTFIVADVILSCSSVFSKKVYSLVDQVALLLLPV